MGVKRLSSCCFRGHNLHVGVTVLRTFSAISFFPPDKFFYFFPKFRRLICTIFLCNKKYRSPCSFKRKRPSHLLRFPLDWEYSAMFEKERMFLHFQRFQNFRSAFFSFFATNFHLFFQTMPFETPIFLAYGLSGKETRHYILLCVIMRSTGCAVQYWGITLSDFPFL